MCLIKEDNMYPIIKPSSEIRKNYNSIAELCRTSHAPVFLTRNGEGDMVIMDIETYNRREEDLASAERLAAAERARAAGAKGYTVEEFEQHIRDAINRGSNLGDR
jgi:PHD/YefM family antitoxin component YafN of YafNO toxin-antitoxin module